MCVFQERGKTFTFSEGFSDNVVHLKWLQADIAYKILGTWISPEENEAEGPSLGKNIEVWKFLGPLRMVSYTTLVWPAL